MWTRVKHGIAGVVACIRFILQYDPSPGWLLAFILGSITTWVCGILDALWLMLNPEGRRAVLTGENAAVIFKILLIVAIAGFWFAVRTCLAWKALTSQSRHITAKWGQRMIDALEAQTHTFSVSCTAIMQETGDISSELTNVLQDAGWQHRPDHGFNLAGTDRSRDRGLAILSGDAFPDSDSILKLQNMLRAQHMACTWVSAASFPNDHILIMVNPI